MRLANFLGQGTPERKGSIRGIRVCPGSLQLPRWVPLRHRCSALCLQVKTQQPT